MTDRRPLDLVDLGARALDLLQDAAGMREQALARLRRSGAATVADEKVLPELDLEASDLPADGRLRDAEQARRPREAAEVDDGDEVLELLQVHGEGLWSAEADPRRSNVTVRAAPCRSA